MTNKDLISQYVDTGTQIPKYQLNKLSSNDKKTYIRKYSNYINPMQFMLIYENHENI